MFSVADNADVNGIFQNGLCRISGATQGIRFIRELEGGKPTLRMDKVNMVLDLFGARLGVVQAKEEE